MTTYLTRVVHFSSAHRYFRPEWTDEKNRDVFGACANPHGHGHNYTLEVTVADAPDPETGFSVNLPLLDRILDEEITSRLDHQHMNYAVEEFAPGELIPTTENIVMWIWSRLEPRISGARLVKLRLREDAGLWVDYLGGEDL
jgi:6-pyruvoyltetrahydropterin/6-carboxytetrahydropterin synthase